MDIPRRCSALPWREKKIFPSSPTGSYGKMQSMFWGWKRNLSTEKRISVPRIIQMLNPVRSKQTAQPLLHLAAATSLSTTTLQRFCHRIAVIDRIVYLLVYQEDIPRYSKAYKQVDSTNKYLQQI